MGDDEEQKKQMESDEVEGKEKDGGGTDQKTLR